MLQRTEVKTPRSVLASWLVAGGLVLAWAQRPISLTDPAACPGAFELLLPILLRGFDSVSAGSLLAWTNAAIALTAIACFTRLLQVATGSLLVASATALTLTLTVSFDRVLSPPTAMAVLAAVSWVWLRACRTSAASHAPVTDEGIDPAAPFGLIPIPLLAPPLFLPVLILVAWAIWQHRTLLSRRHLAIACALVLAVSVLVFAVAGMASSARTASSGVSVFSCVAPWYGSTSAIESFTTTARSIGPLAFALAALGAFCRIGELRRRKSRWVLGCAIAPLVSAPWFDSPAVFVSLFAGLWCLVAIGLAEIASGGRRPGVSRLATVGTYALIGLLPLLQFQRLSTEGAAEPAAGYGHDRLSLQALWPALRAMPEATIVAEDSTIDLLLRAASVERRTGKKIRVVPRQAGVVADAFAEGRVFAFPRAQRELQHWGVQFKPALKVPGFAEVDNVGTCTALGPNWIEIPPLTASTGFALVHTLPDARGPVTLYFGGGDALTARASGWPPRTTRGFTTAEYRRSERPDLPDALRSLGISSSSQLLSAPYVTRIIMWWTPGAPDALPVALSRPPDVVLARAEAGQELSSLALCPWREYKVDSLVR
jgi:hypothetical protein